VVLHSLARIAVIFMSDVPSLIPLHPDSSLIPGKLNQMRQSSTETLQISLLPGQRDCLKTRPDGTILDGHHRIYVLRERGVDVNLLPREVVAKENS
jgi:hypothetical protein